MMGVLALSGCDFLGSGLAQVELDTAVAKWEAQELDTYEYLFSNSCECLPETSGPIIVTVFNGDVAAVRRPAGSNLPDRDGGPQPTVEDLFATVQEAIDEQAASITVEYDAELGYPTQITIDWDATMADEETYYEASDLEAP